MRAVPILASALLAAAAVLTACGGADDETPGSPDDGGNASEELPADFPPDLPLYADAGVQGSEAAEPGASDGTSVTFQTDDALEAVKAFFENSFEDGAWVQVSNSSSSQGASFLVENGGTAASVFISESDGGTSILITYGTKDELGIDDSPDDSAP